MIAERLSGLLLFVSSRVRTFHEATHRRLGFALYFRPLWLDIQPVAVDRQDRLGQEMFKDAFHALFSTWSKQCRP